MAVTTLPSTMRALLHNLTDQSLALKYVPLPVPSANQYLVRTYTAAFTLGELQWPRPEGLTISTPGVEFVARIIKSPSESSKFQAGERVYARVAYPNPGAARDYTIASDDELALVPSNLSVSDAAAVPVSALTAWQALFDEFKFTIPTTPALEASATNTRILITAASGSVGIWATQLAKLAGLHVITTSGPRNIDLVKSLGADEVLDYTKTNIQTWVAEDESRKVDFVFDLIGGSARAQAWHALNDGARLITIVPPPDMQWKFELDVPEGIGADITGRFFIMHPSGEQLGRITELIEGGKFKPLVDSVWNFEEYDKAIERLGSGKTTGKVVLKINEEDQVDRV